MATASDLVNGAMKEAGVLAAGETAGSDDSADVLQALNNLMESWQLERLMCYQVLQESFSLTANVGAYTIGSGGTFDTARPTKIIDPCFVRDSSNLDSQLQIINEVAYGNIVQKNIGTTYPSFLYYDQGYTSSALATINVYPRPSANLTLFINSWKQLQTFSTLTVSTQLPPGYRRAIEKNLGVEISPQFGREPSQALMRAAIQAKAAIKTVNAPDTMMRLDSSVSQRPPNILTGP